MKVDFALQACRQLFFDSAPVIYAVERNPQYIDRLRLIFQLIDVQGIEVCTSPVTLAECIVAPMRLGDTKLVDDFTAHIVSNLGVRFVPIDDLIARQAAELRIRYRLALADAFQVAVALESGCDAILTNDAVFRRVTEIRVIVVDDLEV